MCLFCKRAGMKKKEKLTCIQTGIYYTERFRDFIAFLKFMKINTCCRHIQYLIRLYEKDVVS